MQKKRQEFYQKVAEKRQKNIVLVLEDIHDPHNAAAIFRTADAFGIQEVILIFEEENAYDPHEKFLKKTSAHTNKWLDFRIFHSTEKALQYLEENAYKIFATHLDKKAQSFFETSFENPEKVALIMGNEHRGISEKIQKSSAQTVYIPMQGFCESLNVSVATAIALSEITRQRKNKFPQTSEEIQNLMGKFQQKQQDQKDRKAARKAEAIAKARTKKSKYL